MKFWITKDFVAQFNAKRRDGITIPLKGTVPQLSQVQLLTGTPACAPDSLDWALMLKLITVIQISIFIKINSANTKQKKNIYMTAEHPYSCVLSLW